METSRNDVRRGITIPNCISADLAELAGLIAGDGHIGIYKTGPNSKHSFVHYELRLYGHWEDDFQYYAEYVNSLFERIFNARLKIRRDGNNSLTAYINSKGVFNFLIGQLGFSAGRKAQTVSVPKQILSADKQTKAAFVRGFADADFNLTFKTKHKRFHYYPIISGGDIQSKAIVHEIGSILSTFNIGYNICAVKYFDKRLNRYYSGNSIYVCGKRNLELWMKLIGFCNNKNLDKYLIWKRFGFYPPNISSNDRSKILGGTVAPESFY